MSRRALVELNVLLADSRNAASSRYSDIAQWRTYVKRFAPCDVSTGELGYMHEIITPMPPRNAGHVVQENNKGNHIAV